MIVSASTPNMSFKLHEDSSRLGALRCAMVFSFASMRYDASWCLDSPRCVTMRLGVLIRLDALRCVVLFLTCLDA